MSRNISHPEHYNTGKYECIEVMREVLTEEQIKGFCLGNSFKYLWRAGKKESFIEDIGKAKWYLDYIEEMYSDEV